MTQPSVTASQKTEPKWPHTVTVVVVEVAAEVKVEDKAEVRGVEVQVVEGEETTGGRVPHVAAEMAEMVEAVPRTPTPGTRRPDMLTSLLGSPASVTGPMGNPPTFVWSRGHAPGRTFTSRKPIIEVLTNSRNLTM